jgi:hypothetical protein
MFGRSELHGTAVLVQVSLIILKQTAIAELPTSSDAYRMAVTIHAQRVTTSQKFCWNGEENKRIKYEGNTGIK